MEVVISGVDQGSVSTKGGSPGVVAKGVSEVITDSGRDEPGVVDVVVGDEAEGVEVELDFLVTEAELG